MVLLTAGETSPTLAPPKPITPAALPLIEDSPGPNGPLYAVYPHALKLSPSLPFKAWSALGLWLYDLDEAIQFAWGDWQNFGEDEYGEDMAAQAYPPEWGPKSETLRKYQWVCRNVHRTLRMKMADEYPPTRLKFSHYQTVAALDKNVQEVFLRQAAKNEWKVRRLKEAVDDYKARLELPDAENVQLISLQSTSIRLTPGPMYDPDELAQDIVAALNNLEVGLDGAMITNCEVNVRVSYEKVI